MTEVSISYAIMLFTLCLLIFCHSAIALGNTLLQLQSVTLQLNAIALAFTYSLTAPCCNN